MYHLICQEGEVLLLKFLGKTFKNLSDIDVLIKITKGSEYIIPMKSIIQHNGKRERKVLSNEYIDDLSALIFLYGSLGLTDVLR